MSSPSPVVTDPKLWLVAIVPVAAAVHVLLVRFVRGAVGGDLDSADATTPLPHWLSVSRSLAAGLATLAVGIAVTVAVIPRPLFMSLLALALLQVTFAFVVVYRTFLLTHDGTTLADRLAR